MEPNTFEDNSRRCSTMFSDMFLTTPQVFNDIHVNSNVSKTFFLLDPNAAFNTANPVLLIGRLDK